MAIAFMAVGAADVMAKPKSTLQISLRTALSFNDPPGCNHTPARPCGDHGTFTAKNRAAAVVLCAKGTMAESYYFAATGQPAASSIVKRTLTCSDGSTLVMNVRRVVFTKLTATTTRIHEVWNVTFGTGRFTLLKGKGTMEEIFNTGHLPHTLGGSMIGALNELS